MAQTSHAGDWVARSLGLGVAVVTVSGATHMSESRILAIAGIDASRSLPFFDVAEAKARLEADPLVKQASVRKLYPNQVVIEIVERTPYAVWQKDGDVQRNRRRRRADRRGQSTAATPICRSSSAKARTGACANMSACSTRWTN